MSSFVSCPICSELFKNTDEIYSTSCGHVYHFHCMNQWQSRATTCPDCREYNPQTHKIYLKFEEPTEDDLKIVELKAQLEQSILNASKLENDLEESERNFMNLTNELSVNECKLKDFESKCDYLHLQNGAREEELEKKSNENRELLEHMSNKSDERIILAEKVKILEEKLKQLSLQLAREIKHSAELTVDKMRLQNICQYTAAASINPSNFFNAFENRQQQQPQHLMGRLQPQNSMTSVVIRGLKEEGQTKSLLEIILKLAKQMGLALFEWEIEKVLRMDRYKKNNKKLTVLVEFKSIDTKIQFLSNKAKLKNNEETKQLSINTYVSDQVFSLYHYAQVLKKFGYTSIFYKNDLVFVRKSTDSALQKIYSIAEVDKLVMMAEAAIKSESQ